MTTIYKSTTTGEHFAGQMIEGSVYLSPPLDAGQLADVTAAAARGEDVTIDGEIQEDMSGLRPV